MKTRDKILDTSLHLFNVQGIDPITVRHVAKEMGISHGNLCYHFPRKEDIIQQLYLNLVAELDREIHQLQAQTPQLELILASIKTTFAIQYKYKFILIDFVAIMRNIPAIRTHFRELFIRRQQEFSALIQYMIKAGYFRDEYYTGQYRQFITSFYLIGDFWIAESEILFEGTDAAKLEHYTQLALSLVFPYLTDKGQQELLSVTTASNRESNNNIEVKRG
ncbi:TetR/AcrR family transcriptional regulator [Rhodocytophaga rosea]|uniref:TetR/AcrR family transcriptional regulator n=1 Tax=Rhodocytophaga rosea TaxID=2704465 RepID=A0A6C0GME3_9BACT|nr:TetR/AcrR family transcriptional regulator [Rhodocytophaga rosea]QHT69208.1 TetR/AcrR family transcriptional regulator [Rhodocytophaga rosea]